MSERHSPVETIQEARLAEISDALESAPPQEIVRWAVETYRDQLTVATAFGAEGCF
jgi:phosphoadenosine phosphosulfate reductase